MYRMLVDEIDGALRDVRSASSSFLLHPMLILERCRANRIGSVISCLYLARTIFQKKHCFLISRRQGVNRNLRKCVLRRVNSSRRDRVMGCIRFIPMMILFIRYPPRSLRLCHERRLAQMLLDGILAHADVHLYDTDTGEAGERGVWVGCEGRVMLVPLVDVDAEENGALRRLVGGIG